MNNVIWRASDEPPGIWLTAKYVGASTMYHFSRIHHSSFFIHPHKVAHTFTVPGLGVSAPIPGDSPARHKDITVSFTFKTGAAGLYYWQRMDPCGSSPNGWGGPMTASGYM